MVDFPTFTPFEKELKGYSKVLHNPTPKLTLRDVKEKQKNRFQKSETFQNQGLKEIII